MWLELNAARQSNGFGPQTFTTSEALAAVEIWDIRGIDERTYCLSLLRSLDATYLVWHQEESSEGSVNDGNPPGSD